MATATQLILRGRRFSDEPELTDTDQGSTYIYFALPLGTTIGDVEALNYSAPYRASLRYMGDLADLSTDCSFDPEEGDEPTFKVYTLPNGVRGMDYSINILYDDIGEAATGQTILSVLPEGLPDYLRYSSAPLARTLRILGRFYSDNNPVTFNITLYQSDGKTASQPFTIGMGDTDLRVYILAYSDTRQIRPLIGSSSPNVPTLQIVDGPAGYNGNVFSARAFDTAIGATTYQFDFLGYTAMPTGEYAIKITQGGTVRYIKVVWTGSEIAAAQTLYTSQPSVTNGSGGGSGSITVTSVDVSYTPPVGSALNKLYTYVKLSGVDTGAQIAYEQLDSAGAVVTPKSAYFNMPAYSDGTGYQWRDLLDNMNARIRLYIRPASNTGAEVILVYARPTAAQSRTTIYPAAGNSDLTTPYNYTGVSSGGYQSTNPSFFSVGYTFSGGRITNLNNTANPTLGSNQAFMVKINGIIYSYNADTDQFFRVNDTTGAISGTATAISLSPQTAHLFQFFRINTTRSVVGADGVAGWFDQPVDEASQILRVL